MNATGQIEVATTGEVAEAFSALSDADLARLNAIAKFRALSAPGLDWQDLLHTAIEDSLDGTRSWPRHLPFLVFMREAMRSIASEYRRKFVGGVIQLEADLPVAEDGTTAVSSAVSNRPGPDREIAARQAVEAIRRLFRDDPAALAVLKGLENSASPGETQRNGGLTATQYASAQKRIRRALIKNFPEGMEQ